MIQIGTVERDAVGSASDGWGRLNFNSSLIANDCSGAPWTSHYQYFYKKSGGHRPPLQ